MLTASTYRCRSRTRQRILSYSFLTWPSSRTDRATERNPVQKTKKVSNKSTTWASLLIIYVDGFLFVFPNKGLILLFMYLECLFLYTLQIPQCENLGNRNSPYPSFAELLLTGGQCCYLLSSHCSRQILQSSDSSVREYGQLNDWPEAYMSGIKRLRQLGESFNKQAIFVLVFTPACKGPQGQPEM